MERKEGMVKEGRERENGKRGVIE
jgi:hypothetical protein